MQSRWFAPLLLLAAVCGWLLATYTASPWLHDLTLTIRATFLAALKMIIAPLIFFSLIGGILQLRSAASIGRIGGLTITYYLVTSAIAIGIGLSVVFFIHPWTAYPPLSALPTSDAILIDATSSGHLELINNVLAALFTNPFQAMAELNILGILMNAVLLGLAAALILPKDSQWPQLITQINQVIYKVATWILTLLPLGLFAITYQLASSVDLQVLASLGQFAAVVFGATAFHGLVVLPCLAWWLGKRAPLDLLRHIAQPLLTAFLTSSSAATLPHSTQAARERLCLPAEHVAFVLPLGATVNMDGTALFEGIAVIYLAYMFNIPLDGLSLVIVFLVTMLASVGAPGIPSGSMAGLQMVLLAVGIPLEAIGLVLLVERPLDTFRTAVNVEGDLVGATVVSRWAR